MFSSLVTILEVLKHTFHRRVTIQYPDQNRTCPRAGAGASC